MQKVTQEAINASGGADTLIRLSVAAAKVFITEDGSVASQGLIYKLLRLPLRDENPLATTHALIDNRYYIVGPEINVPAAQEPVTVEGYPGDRPPNTAPIGSPNMPLLYIRSAGAAGTTINIAEWVA